VSDVAEVITLNIPMQAAFAVGGPAAIATSFPNEASLHLDSFAYAYKRSSPSINLGVTNCQAGIGSNINFPTAPFGLLPEFSGAGTGAVWYNLYMNWTEQLCTGTTWGLYSSDAWANSTAHQARAGFERLVFVQNSATSLRWSPALEVSKQAATPLAKLEQALEPWRGNLASHHFSSMERHIHRLFHDEEAVAEDGVDPSLSSFNNLLAFLFDRPWVKSPALGMDRRGIFAVSWAPDRNVRADFTLQFLNDGTVRWFFVDARRDKVISGAGTLLSEQADAVLATYRGSDWWMLR
jgi:hypothetical protein